MEQEERVPPLFSGLNVNGIMGASPLILYNHNGKASPIAERYESTPVIFYFSTPFYMKKKKNLCEYTIVLGFLLELKTVLTKETIIKELFFLSEIFNKIQTCLRDTACSVSDHHTKESIAIKQATWSFGFLVHMKMCAYTIL